MTDTDQLRALRASTDLLAIWDENGDFLGASAGVMALVSDDPLLGLATEGWTQLAAARARLDATHPVQRLRLVHATAGGGWAALDWCLCTAVGGIVIGQAVQAEGAHDEVKAALLREAIGALPDGFALFDPDDRLVLWNARYLQIFEGHPTPGWKGCALTILPSFALTWGCIVGLNGLIPII
ncbi:PAS domain-containing protein [Gemmobacter lanyuensis]